MRLKLEINCREHFHVLPWVDFPYEVKSGWFSGKCSIRTYHANELLGTKLRALYQRSKGRDLFDLDYARRNISINKDEILQCFKGYIEFGTGKRAPSQKEFLENIMEKQSNPNFLGDMEGLLRPEITYRAKDAFQWLKKEIIEGM
jgi:predicted nucleotidyltransferase component of viral defense system